MHLKQFVFLFLKLGNTDSLETLFDLDSVYKSLGTHFLM